MLNLETGNGPLEVRELTKWFLELEKEAKNVQTELKKAVDPQKAKELNARLKDVNLSMAMINQEAKNRTLEKSLKLAADQARQLRERMQKVQQVGNQLMITGGAILAPFILSVRKYVDTVGESEETSRKITELSKRWADDQVRIGRVTADVLLPALEKALDVIDKITEFTEKNPGFVKAAVGIGTSLVVLGGIVTTTAKIVSTIATVQELLASAGIGGTGAAASAAGAGGTGLSAAVAAGMEAAAPVLAVALAVVIAAELTRRLVNWTMGTNKTWADIGETARQLLIISAEGWKLLPGYLSDLFGETWKNATEISQKLGGILINGFRAGLMSLANSFMAGLRSIGNAIGSAFSTIASVLRSVAHFLGAGVQGFATGGYLTKSGLFRGGEGGREFVMSNRTTRAAESMLGGNLTQSRLLQILSGRQTTYNDHRRFDASVSQRDRRMILDDTMTALSGAI